MILFSLIPFISNAIVVEWYVQVIIEPRHPFLFLHLPTSFIEGEVVCSYTQRRLEWFVTLLLYLTQVAERALKYIHSDDEVILITTSLNVLV